ncbi:DUF3035 domain-containing protein [Phaeovulum vinaykumarii]|uniref:Beta-barrel assembly machine subunit BamF n=1 Tax=Phaeovulum vinaykumarii TaxID=407234 RepID=A0A1N7KYS9_9RHOB|nr:DUF3035 domain-containing protein [Phaeovulum vinaykumarii]SIS66656.1 Beta-barrel assembly machine subunit BamF [Phaeovulum vinaykumarii]SOC01013.1 beta-barrel assembly complex subunit BamF [Phaeovulum vinaykumarii]
MVAPFRTLAVVAVLAAALAGCSKAEPKLMHARASGTGPDEFGILPTKPLQMPEDLTALPEPTPGGTSLADPTPEADAVAALGGNPAALTRTGMSGADAALVARTGRFGRDAGIRDRLAAEDLEFRRDNDGRLLERLMSVNVYFRAYEPMSLDQEAELERWRRLGVRTVAAPPSAGAQQAFNGTE